MSGLFNNVVAETEALEAWNVGVKDCITPNGLMLLLDMAVEGRADINTQEIVGVILDDVVETINIIVRNKLGQPERLDNGPLETAIALIGKEITDAINDAVGYHYGELVP